jgi:uncharacterized membrane protein
MSRSFPTSKVSLRFSSILLLFIAISILLRVINLGNREFWYDEVLSLLLAPGQKVAYQTPKDTPVLLADYTTLLNLPVEGGIHGVLETGKNLLKGIAGGEPHPPLFFLTQHLWLRLFGNSEAAMRSLSAGLSVTAIAGAFGLGRILLGQQGSLLFTALLAVNPYYLFHSLNVRMYGPLVFWTILSAWALLELISLERTVEQERGTQNRQQEKCFRSKLSSATRVASLQSSTLLWNLLLITSVAAGLMTFYLFAYWLLALAAIVLVLGKSRWWQHGLRLGAGIILTMPWVLWGTRQQLHNADLNRFSTSAGSIETGWRHVQDVLQILGIHLILGDWITGLPASSATVAGGVAALMLLVSAIALWRQQTVTSNLLAITLLMGIFPLLVGLMADVMAGKFTISFGWGRATIFILPGCLLLLTAGIERAAGQWKRPIAIALLMLFLSLSIADFTARSRWMFHQVADLIEQDSTAPTLILLDSQAWGHVMRLAYYIPPTSSVWLLAQASANLAPALDKTLLSQPKLYQRILWLDSAEPVWSTPSTASQRQQIRQILQRQFKLKKTKHLSGTMDLDRFTVEFYQRFASDS